MWLYARVFKKRFSALACYVAMCKGFKGNVQILLLCARVLSECGGICGYVQGFQRICFWLWPVLSLCARVLREMFRSCRYVQEFLGNADACQLITSTADLNRSSQKSISEDNLNSSCRKMIRTDDLNR